MKIVFTEIAWDEYLYWSTQDKRTITKINRLIKSICSNGILEGEGKPEKLRYHEGYSRRIDSKNRLVYFVRDNNLYLISCKGHYDDR